MTAISSGSASWQRLAGQRSNAIAGFGLFTLEDALSFVIVAPMAGQPLADRVHRQLRVWTVESGSPARAIKLSDASVELPIADELALAAHDGKVVLAVVQNFQHPGVAGQFSGFGWAAVKGAASVAPVALAPWQRALVSLDSAQAWSTSTIPCEEWLFDPSVHEGVLGAIGLTFGTVDGQTAIFAYAPASGAVQPLCVVPRAVNAVALPTTGGVDVFHRIPDADWSGYLDSQYSWTRGPVALPLRVTKVGLGGELSQSVEPVTGVGDEPVFAFDATLAEDGSLLLALVYGDAKNPLVTVGRLTPDGETSTLPPLALSAPVVAVRLRPSPQGIALAVLTRVNFDRIAELYHHDPFP